METGVNANRRPPAERISLVVSDVDGTLVTHDKELKPATIAAANRLREAGIGFAAVSSRPPRGMRMLVEPLALDIFGGFNGSAIMRSDFSVVEQHFVPLEAARIGVEAMRRAGADIWVFADNQWIITNPDGAYVPRERITVQFEPTVVDDLTPYLDRAGKIVGSSRDFDLLARCETELQALLGTTASARRSQNYYLDLTHPTADKGYALKAFAAHWGVPIEEVAAIGDMVNDLPMLTQAGLAIAMGNASAEVKERTHFVTTSNEEDGVAHAIDTFILPRAATRQPAAAGMTSI
jgi:Cof subfamily protein (haloacid dehalogenase superfamily)